MPARACSSAASAQKRWKRSSTSGACGIFTRGLRGRVLRQGRLEAPRPEKSRRAREAERLCRTYAVIGSNGVVITVGYRYRRVARD